MKHLCIGGWWCDEKVKVDIFLQVSPTEFILFKGECPLLRVTIGLNGFSSSLFSKLPIYNPNFIKLIVIIKKHPP